MFYSGDKIPIKEIKYFYGRNLDKNIDFLNDMEYIEIEEIIMMKKIEWGFMTIGFGSRWYSLEGTEKDKEFVEAFFNRDKGKMLELINQGVNRDVIVTIKRNNIEKTGTLIYHLLTEEPKKSIPFQAEVATTNQITRKDIQRHEKAENDKRLAQVAKINNERAGQIIDMLEFWIDIGGDVEEFNAKEVKFSKVDKYLQRAVQIPSLIDAHMQEKGFEYNEETDKLYARKIVEYRRSSLTIDEIKEAIKTDLQLRGKLHFTDLFKKKTDEDADFFEKLDAQFDAQEKQLSGQEADEDFFAKTEKKHAEFFAEKQQPDEEFFKRVEEKHRAFFEEDAKDDSDKGSLGGGSFFTCGVTRPVVINEVQKNGMFLEKVAREYGDDIEVVLLAVQNNANAFAFASKKIRENKDAVELFVETKQIEIEEMKKKGASDALIINLQNQIQVILELHERALEEKEQSHYQGMSM